MNIFLESFVYLLALLWFTYLPAEGIFLLGGIQYSGWRRVALALTVGIASIIFLSYAAAFIGMRYLSPAILSFFSVLALIRRKQWIGLLKKDWHAPHILLFIFVIMFSLSVVTSGWETAQGLIMRSANGQDGIWNIALARELQEPFPAGHPSIAGEPLRGYHVFYNLWISELSRILPRLTLTHLHYHFAAFTMSVLFVYGVFALAMHLTQRTLQSLWATFFAVFGGSFSFVLPFIFHRDLSFDDAFGVTQPYSLLLSPSVTLSLIVIVWTYILIADFTHKKNILTAFLIIILAGITVGIKVYGGVIVMASLGLYSAYYFLWRREWAFGIIAVFSGLLSAFCFFPFNASYGFLIYEFLWPTHQLMRGTLNFTDWDLKRETLLSMGSKRGLFKLEVQAMSWFIIGNLGTRLIGIFGLASLYKTREPVVWLLTISLFVSSIIPMLFIQPIGVYNMIQFFWYFLVFIGILCGIGVAIILARLPKIAAVVCGCLIVLFTLPSAGWRIYYLFKSYQIPVSHDQLSLYRQLATVGSYTDTVIELPNLTNYSAKEFMQWNASMSLPFIPAFGGKRIFVGNEVVQFRYEDLWKDRIVMLEAFMSPQGSIDPAAKPSAYAVLKKLQDIYNVRYILTNNQKVWFDGESGFKKILSNAYGSVYEVSK